MSTGTDVITEKVYCQGYPCNSGNDALTTAALMNGGMGGANAMWNNPMMYLVWLAVLGGGCGGGLFGNRGNCNNNEGAEIQARLNSLQATMDTNHNNDLAMEAIRGNGSAIRELSGVMNCDFNTLHQAVCGVQNAITQVGGQVGYTSERVINSVLLGNKDLLATISKCCCDNKLLVTQQGYENRLQSQQNMGLVLGRIDQLANGVQQGFSATAYEAAKNACDIIQSGNANTQRIIDVMNNHWQADLQQRYNDARLELSQKAQNEYLVSQLKTTT